MTRNHNQIFDIAPLHRIPLHTETKAVMEGRGIGYMLTCSGTIAVTPDKYDAHLLNRISL
jgi:hypothetical protein